METGDLEDPVDVGVVDAPRLRLRPVVDRRAPRQSGSERPRPLPRLRIEQGTGSQGADVIRPAGMEQGALLKRERKAAFQRAVQPVWAQYEATFGPEIMGLYRRAVA